MDSRKVQNQEQLEQQKQANNLFATAADIIGAKIPEAAAPDSFSILPVLTGKKLDKPTHPYVIHHSISGSFSIRQGKWKYLLHPNSGGWSQGGDGKPSQLYDMEKDQKEQKNLVDEYPEKAKEMLALIEGAVAAGRSTPGPKLENDAEVVLWKKSSGKKKKGKKNKK